ncbi:MAG: exodeoxyribonuclease V subunit gamma [Deltaproteobacteria bacterium]|nr:exodeoxyribonuclease V subunit gamma [Deltaproteobacteria bacterium]
MNGVRIFTSNRLENLAELLAEVLREPLSSPFSGEIVLVQSKGMERWVSMQLARYHGICANIRFPFPNAFVREMFRRVIPDLLSRASQVLWKGDRTPQNLPAFGEDRGPV